jgi:isocitrate/isopropylmalate dehydrogenase
MISSPKRIRYFTFAIFTILPFACESFGSGGLGFAPSANLGDNYAVFEPTHGSAPKYAGQYKVNPIAMLLTAKLMLDWLKETQMATRLETAIARVIAEGKVRTYDMGDNASTLDVAKAIADYAG